jgi:hypothetical protein
MKFNVDSEPFWETDITTLKGEVCRRYVEISTLDLANFKPEVLGRPLYLSTRATRKKYSMTACSLCMYAYIQCDQWI